MNISNKIVQQVIDETKKKKEKINDYPRLYTGSTLRDLILGGETGKLGVKTGIIWNMIGEASAGKTFEADELIAVNKKIYKDKFKWNFDNAEGGNEVNSKKLYGFEIINDKSLRSSTVEELCLNIKKFLSTLKKDELGCYIIDSLDALISREVENRIKEREKANEKGKDYDVGSYMMGKQKYLKQEFFPEIKPLIEKSNCLLIIISQQSEKIGVFFGSKKERAGGKALRYFSHVESWVKEIEKIKVRKKGEIRVIGVRNKTEFTRTRNARPFRSHFNTIYFDYGIDDLSSNLDFLFNLLTDSGKDKTNFNVEYKNQNFLSKKDLILFIENNNLENEIKNEVIEKWEIIEDIIRIKRKKKY
jgi:RecA/RadA recombinase